MQVGEHGKRPSGRKIEVDQHDVARGGRYRLEHLVTIPCLAHAKSSSASSTSLTPARKIGTGSAMRTQVRVT